ncbi:MAG: DUF502 domain-containing protein [Chloroflexi bacterium]|nr:DUF502 domain-containing protein [Chloroflexota bacterium]
MWAHLEQTFLAGLLLVIPVAATLTVLVFLFMVIDGLLQPWISFLVGQRIPGVGLLVLLLLIYLVGLFTANVLGRRLVTFAQESLLRVPLVNTFYAAAKGLAEVLTRINQTSGGRRVVLLEFPRLGSWTIGFRMGTTKGAAGEPMAVVYIPSVPTPQTGWVAILPVDQVYDTDLTFQEAMAFVFSAGAVTPASLKSQRPALDRQ